VCISYTTTASLGGKSFLVIGGVSLPTEERNNESHTLKRFIALALVTLGVSVSARAQWIVYDPANTVQSVVNTAQEIALSSSR
jgi:hypothetical protein